MRIKMMRLDATRISTNRALLVSLGRALMTSISCEHTCIINTWIVFSAKLLSIEFSFQESDCHLHHFIIDGDDIYASCMKYSEHASFSIWIEMLKWWIYNITFIG